MFDRLFMLQVFEFQKFTKTIRGSFFSRDNQPIFGMLAGPATAFFAGVETGFQRGKQAGE